MNLRVGWELNLTWVDVNLQYQGNLASGFWKIQFSIFGWRFVQKRIKITTIACKVSGIRWKLNWACKIASELVESVKVDVCNLEFVERIWILRYPNLGFKPFFDFWCILWYYHLQIPTRILIPRTLGVLISIRETITFYSSW